MIDFNIICLFGNFIAIFMYFGVSLFIGFAIPKSLQTRNLIIFNLCVGFWCLCPILINLDFFSYNEKIIIQRACYVFAVLLIPAFYNFVSSIINEDIFKKIRLPLYISSSIFISFLATNYFIKDVSLYKNLYQSNPGIIYYFFIAYLMTIFLILTYKIHKHESEHKYILLNGFLIQLFGGGIYFATILKWLPVYTFAGYVIAIGEFLLFYAVIKYDFTIYNENKQNAFQRYITETTKELIELKDLKTLSTNIENLLKRNTDCLNCEVFILQENKYKSYSNAKDIINKNTDFINIIISKHEIIIYNDVVKWAHEFKMENFLNLKAFFERKGLSYIVPLFFGDLIGFICIGAKKTNKNYTETDIKIFDLISYSASIAIQNVLLETNNIKDDLTGLYNKKFFNSKFQEYINLSIKNDRNFTLGFIDIDNFSKLNEELGHPNCDEKLKEFASLCNEHFRVDDFIARWGGEEFVILFPDIILEDGLRRLDDFRKIVTKKLNITFSSGVVFFDGKLKEQKEKNVKQIMRDLAKEADDYMYKAKKSGKNQIYSNYQN
jgi:diguanylate cyclase (GGDEF)-like protein